MHAALTNLSTVFCMAHRSHCLQHSSNNHIGNNSKVRFRIAEP